MRNFLRDHWKVIVAIILLVVLAMFTVNPGAATPAPSLAERLRAHAAAIAPGADDSAGPRQVQQAARYIEATLEGDGYAIRHEANAAGSQAVRDIEVSLANLAPHAKPKRIFIVGAHVRAPGGAADPDANRAENARGSGTAAVLELARLLKDVHPSLGTEIRFVFFFEKAPPWLGAPVGGHLGGQLNAHMRGQHFIAFVGTLAASRRVQQTLAAFQGSAGIPAHGLASPAYVQGVTLSGQAGWQGAGAPAVMVTDTAFGRYPFYEATNDTDNGADADPPDQPAEPAQPTLPDYAGIARVVSGLARAIEALAAAQQG